jgi:hypothetical protein
MVGIVPRWGDTNLMLVVGETPVLGELLERIYRRLKPEFDR